MKISSDPNHSAYHQAVDVCRIYHEGAQRNNVITADEEGRFAVTMRLDEFGNPMHKAGKLLTDPFYGAVRIECPEWVRQERESGKREACVTINFNIGPIIHSANAVGKAMAAQAQSTLSRRAIRNP